MAVADGVAEAAGAPYPGTGSLGAAEAEALPAAPLLATAPHAVKANATPASRAGIPNKRFIVISFEATLPQFNIYLASEIIFSTNLSRKLDIPVLMAYTARRYSNGARLD
jgi:hypothetical protein